MYEIFANLLEERNLKAADVCKGTGLPSSLFSEWKRGKSTPKADKLKKIADYFGVTLDYIMTGTTGNDVCSPCPDCGLWYDPNTDKDVKLHAQQHSAWEKAVDKFGELYCDYPEREKIKAEGRNVSRNTKLPLSERCAAQIKVLRCLFSRSVQANNFDLKHVPFDTYVSMMLDNNSYRHNNLEDDLFEALSEKFGTLPGISHGSYYYVPETKTLTSEITKKDERDIAKDLDSIMTKLSSNEYGPAAYNGEDLDPEAAELFKDELEIALRRLKLINKEKYTPKKFKK